MHVAMTSSPGRSPILRREYLHLLMTVEAGLLDIPRNCFRSMTHPHHALSRSRSRVGTSQSQIWCARIRPSRPRVRSESGFLGPPGVIHIDGHTHAGPERIAQIERLFEGVDAGTIAAYIGCSGSMASGMRQARA